MANSVLHALSSFITSIGIASEDSTDTRLEKTLLVMSAMMMATLAIVWGSIYLLFGERVAAAIPLSYTALSYASIAHFARTRRYQFFRSSQLLFPLLLPFFLGLALGGFSNSSAVVLWSLTSPLGALMFAGRREAIRWFLAYLGLILLSALLEPFLRASNSLPSGMTNAFYVMNVGCTSSVAFILLQYFVLQKDRAMSLLHQEQRKSESLLLNILPKEVAEILKQRTGTVADYYAEASILFADIVNFTPMTAELTPVELVDTLTEVFGYFDTLVEKYNLEKIKTVGDSYMVAAGVPRTRPDHAHVLARMALEVQEYFGSIACQGRQLDFRIGINSGPLVAGVIGKKKFQYDLYGDSVNTASRMESHGVPRRIQITRETYELVREDFVCQRRGIVDVKGKGPMEVWFVVGQRTGSDRTQVRAPADGPF
jgi:guanylate cyclase